MLKKQKSPSSEEIAGLGGKAKELAQISNQTLLRENVLVLKRVEDTERKLILVPAGLEVRIIRDLHEGVGASHQAAKATTAKVIQRFYWPGLKRDVKLYVAGSNLVRNIGGRLVLQKLGCARWKLAVEEIVS